MEKIERPLTWVLIIGLLGYLFMGDCCKSECESKETKTKVVKAKVIATDVDTNMDIDSMINVAIEEFDTETSIEEADSLVEIIVDLTEKEIKKAEEEIE